MEDVIDDVEWHGYSVTRSQLDRWRSRGIVPSPVRTGLGYGKGSESLYPFWTVPLIVDVLEALKADRNLDRAGWYAWLRGWEVTRFVRAQLRVHIQEAREGRLQARLQGRVSRDDPIALWGPTVRYPLRLWFGRRLVEDAERLLAEVVLGVFDGEWVDPETHAEFLANIPLPAGDPAEAWNSLRASLVELSKLGGARAQELALETVTDEQLRETQIELLTLAQLWNPERGSLGLGRAPVRLLPWWIPLRWGDSSWSRRIQDFLQSPDWREQLEVRVSLLRGGVPVP